jgi:hypothetical protein
MPPRQTAGKRLVRQLNKALAPGAEWDEREQIALGLVEDAADRAAVLRTLFDIESNREQVSTRRVTELAAEIRQTEATIEKLVAQLMPDPEAVPVKWCIHGMANTRQFSVCRRVGWCRSGHR